MQRLIFGLIFFLQTFLYACQSGMETIVSPQPTSVTLHAETTESSTFVLETVIITPQPTIQATLPKITPESIRSSIQNIASAQVQNVWWPSDSQTLFYGVPMKNLAYEIESGTVQELSLEMVYQQTVQPDILTHLPPEATEAFVSPDGNRALYFTLTTPTPTPLPEGMGEAGYYEMRAELWLYEQNGDTQRFGEVEFCGYGEPLWIDEQKVILPNWDHLSNCGDTQAWLVNLQKNSLHPLFPREIYESPVRIYGLSPNGQYLLYGVLRYNENGLPSNPLFILDVNAGESTPLNTLNIAHGKQWLTNEKILVSYLKSEEVDDLTLGIYDLKTSNLVDLTPMFEEKCIRFSTVSPDLKWLAFATGEGIDACNILSDLWLMELNLDR